MNKGSIIFLWIQSLFYSVIVYVVVFKIIIDESLDIA